MYRMLAYYILYYLTLQSSPMNTYKYNNNDYFEYTSNLY